MKVDLPGAVKGEVLEQTCIKAAEELGYRAIPKDSYRERYSLEGVRKIRDYDETNIDIKRKFPLYFLVLKVRGINKKNQSQSSFYIWAGWPHSYASESTIQEYLGAVSSHLDKTELKTELKEARESILAFNGR